MLLENIKLGGKSSFIDTYLYRYPQNENSLILNALDIEFQFHLQKIHQLSKKNANYEKKEMELYYKKEQRMLELYKELRESKLDLEKISRDYSKHIICLEYQLLNSSPFLNHDVFYQNYPFCEDVRKKVMDMDCYPSFLDYYERVLKL